LNHSCEANVLDYGLDFGIAVRDIDVDEEIFCDYRTFASDPGWRVECLCGSRLCSRVVGPAFPIEDGLTSRWTARIGRALDYLHEIRQPLDGSLREASVAYNRAREAGFRLDPFTYSIRRHPAPVEAFACS
jgi:hypothetical protein